MNINSPRLVVPVGIFLIAYSLRLMQFQTETGLTYLLEVLFFLAAYPFVRAKVRNGAWTNDAYLVAVFIGAGFAVILAVAILTVTNI